MADTLRRSYRKAIRAKSEAIAARLPVALTSGAGSMPLLSEIIINVYANTISTQSGYCFAFCAD